MSGVTWSHQHWRRRTATQRRHQSVDASRCWRVRHGVCSHMRCQVDIDGTQHRHDGQVEEGEACQLHLGGGANEGRGHGQQHAHCAVQAASLSSQHLPD